MVTKSVNIVRKDLCETLENMKLQLQADMDKIKLGTTISYADLIDSLLEAKAEQIEVLITSEGRFEGSKALAGKTIFYQVK